MGVINRILGWGGYFLFGSSVVADEIGRSAEIEAEIQRTGRYAYSDLDGDGRSNYEEMLDFTDPYRADQPARELSKAERFAARRAAVEARKESDSAKRSRFEALLERRGVLRRPEPANDEKERREKDGAEEVPFEGSFLWQPMMFCNAQAPVMPKIIAMERLSNGQVLLA